MTRPETTDIVSYYILSSVLSRRLNNVGVNGGRKCMLVIIGADEWGNKDVLSLIDGFRESTQS